MNPNQQSTIPSSSALTITEEEGRDRGKRRTKERAHQRQQVREERNNLRNHKRDRPVRRDDAHPRPPPLQGVAVPVARVPAKDAEEDEPRSHAPVERAEEDDGRDRKAERDLLVERREGAERGGSHVLIADPVVHERATEREDDHLGDRDGPEGLREVLGLLHLGDELRYAPMWGQRGETEKSGRGRDIQTGG